MSKSRTIGNLGDAIKTDLSSWTTPDRSDAVRTVLDSASQFIEQIDEFTNRPNFSHLLIKRNIEERANQLGVLAIDVSNISCEDAATIVKAGQAVEIHRGDQGFNPNTVSVLWGDDGTLCVNTLASIVSNYTVWNR